MPDPSIFFWIVVSVADASAINTNDTEPPLANE